MPAFLFFERKKTNEEKDTTSVSEETRFTGKALRACEVDILQSYEAKSSNRKGGMKKPDVRHPVFLCV